MRSALTRERRVASSSLTSRSLSEIEVMHSDRKKLTTHDLVALDGDCQACRALQAFNDSSQAKFRRCSCVALCEAGGIAARKAAGPAIGK
jgi:hypothetical protein